MLLSAVTGLPPAEGVLGGAGGGLAGAEAEEEAFGGDGRGAGGDPAQSVRPEVYRRILSPARQQGYRPNALAQALKRRHTGAIAFVIPLLRNPIWVRLQRGALQRAGDRG